MTTIQTLLQARDLLHDQLDRLFQDHGIQCTDRLTLFAGYVIHLMYRHEQPKSPNHSRIICTCGYASEWKTAAEWRKEPCLHARFNEIKTP